MKTLRLLTAGAIGCLTITQLASCGYSVTAKTEQASTTTSSAGAVAGKMSMSISKSGALVYSDNASAGASSLKLIAGENYQLSLSQVNAIPGSSYSLELSQTNVIGGAVKKIPVSLGANSFSVNQQGDYSLKVIATPPSGSPMSSMYLAAVSCANPSFTADRLDASKISVQSTGVNLFRLSAAGVTQNANGMPPYSCAWDPTGTGIQDSDFADCANPVNNFYSNFLGSRKVGLIVKDSCNTTYTIYNNQNFMISNSQAVSSVEPAMPGNNFISGTVSNAKGTAISDSRADGVKYLATNQNGMRVVTTNVSGVNNGGFQISSNMSYNRLSSVQFGVTIKLKGLQSNINVSAGTGTIDASAATIDSVIYKTDQAGDQAPAISFSGASCVLSDQHAQVMFTPGTPCDAGKSGDNNKATVEVWGHYKCTGLSSAGGKIDIEGNFDGFDNLSNSCSGGGGGGGGQPPIKL